MGFEYGFSQLLQALDDISLVNGQFPWWFSCNSNIVLTKLCFYHEYPEQNYRPFEIPHQMYFPQRSAVLCSSSNRFFTYLFRYEEVGALIFSLHRQWNNESRREFIFALRYANQQWSHDKKSKIWFQMVFCMKETIRESKNWLHFDFVYFGSAFKF